MAFSDFSGAEAWLAPRERPRALRNEKRGGVGFGIGVGIGLGIGVGIGLGIGVGVGHAARGLGVRR